jgi:hypothetical protein
MQTGKGDHPRLVQQAEDGGGGAGFNEFLSMKGHASSQTPPPPSFAHAPDGPPPPLSRVRTSLFVLAAHRARVMRGTARKFRLHISEGRRSADRRMVQVCPRHARRRYRLKALRARSPLGAPRAVLAAQINATAQPRPRFMRTGGCGRYPHHRTHPQRCTSRTGHSAGRVDAQAARERGYKPRPQEPHSLRTQACLEATSLR